MCFGSPISLTAQRQAASYLPNFELPPPPSIPNTIPSFGDFIVYYFSPGSNRTQEPKYQNLSTESNLQSFNGSQHSVSIPKATSFWTFSIQAPPTLSGSGTSSTYQSLPPHPVHFHMQTSTYPEYPSTNSSASSILSTDSSYYLVPSYQSLLPYSVSSMECFDTQAYSDSCCPSARSSAHPILSNDSGYHSVSLSPPLNIC